MKHQAELEFFVQYIKSFHIPCTFLSFPYEDVPELDLGIRRLIDPSKSFQEYMDLDSDKYKANTVYYINDHFHCSYLFFQIPDSNPLTYLFIGPFLTKPFSSTDLYNYVGQFAVPPGLVKQLEHYYRFLTLVPDDGLLFNLISVLGDKLWGGTENYSFETLLPTDKQKPTVAKGFPLFEEEELPAFSVKRIEERYEIENQFIIAVSQGQVMRAEKFLAPYGFTNLEPRTPDALRNDKNYSIILNTLLRKAAELGSVHPYHIDAISSRYARKIELASTTKEIEHLHREMIHKYCLLVKNHSMKGYSLLIRKLLTKIDTDLTADLSLNTLASELNVNSSYLSTLFKKETGNTLTEYVNRKRIDHALLLLNSTTMQIQAIAQHCGISDVNYFTKLFKKQIGKTPKEYRESLYPRK